MTLGSPSVSLDEPALGEQHDDAVEGSRQRVGRRGHLLLNLCVVALDAQVSLGEAGLLLTVRRGGGRGWRRQLLAQARQLGIDVVVLRLATSPAPVGDVIPAVADRSADATSRRTRGWRCSTRLGNVIEPTFAEAPE